MRVTLVILLILLLLISGLVINDSSFGGVRLTFYALLHAVLIIIPIGLFMIIALRRGVRHRVLVLSIGACGSGIFVFIDFWIWMLVPQFASYICGIALLVMLVIGFNEYKKLSQMDTLHEWGFIVALWFFYALFILSAGLSPWGIQDVLYNVAHRFSHELPSDNQLPYVFAQQIATGNVLMPMIDGWLSSDRPPLQTAYFLASGAVKLSYSDLHYQVNATLLQCLWVIALWAFLKSKHIKRYAIILTLSVSMFSSIAIVHSLYTWPKLLPVFFILLLVGVLFDDDKKWLELWKVGVLVGILAALAMLCHGGSIFPLLGIGLGVLFFQRIPKPVFILATIGGCLILMLAWSYYQTHIDPPGNRLLKWHLAGVIPVDERPFRQTLIDSYSALSVAEIWNNKWLNVLTMFGNPQDWFFGLLRSAVGLTTIAERVFLRDMQFFILFQALGIFSIAFIALFAPKLIRMSPEYILGRTLLVMGAGIGLFWVLLLFGPPNYTIIHAGSLVLPVFLICGSVLVVSAWSILFAGVLAVMHFIIIISLFFSYGWCMDGVVPDLSLYILAAISLCFTIVLLPASSKCNTIILKVTH